MTLKQNYCKELLRVSERHVTQITFPFLLRTNLTTKTNIKLKSNKLKVALFIYATHSFTLTSFKLLKTCQ